MISDTIDKILIDIADEGGKTFFVGGCVRDHILGLKPKDIDMEVYNLERDQLRDVLARHGRVDDVGKSFGVLKLRTPNEELDFSLPRRDSKTGAGHKGFRVDYDPGMSTEEASLRRDFTINSMMLSPLGNEDYDIIDHHGGIDDISRNILRHVSDEHFVEDPLRVLRGMQFSARFNLLPTGNLVKLCRSIKDSFHELPRERVWNEWEKWASKSIKPSMAIHFLMRTKWIEHFPEIANMSGVKQCPGHHPEGTVITHTAHVCNAMSSICNREQIEGDDRLVLMFAALTHDMGKPSTTKFERGRWRSPEHASAGVPIAEQFLRSINAPCRIVDRVLPLVAEHMFPSWEQPSRRAIRRLKVRLAPCSVQELLLLMEADRSGRPPLPGGPPKYSSEILRISEEELPPAIDGIIKGRHIIELGYEPGPLIGLMVKEAFEAQLNEEFDTIEGGIEWMKRTSQGAATKPCMR